MFVELGLAAAGFYAYNWLNKSDERKFKNDFNEIMNGIGIKNKNDETFNIYKIEPKSYGYTCYINIPKGLSMEHLNSKLNILEDNLNGIIEVEKDKFESHMTMRIVNKDIAKFKFAPVKAKNYQLWIGKDFKGQDYFINLNKDAHILIGGATGTGKSFLLASILANLIYNSSKYIDMYMLQICKSEISAFESCECVKASAYTMPDCLRYVRKLCNILDERSNLFKQHGIRNITQWNTHFKNNKMKRVICVIEEISFFIDQLDIWEGILMIAKAGRSVGIHIISCVQRSTATNIPPDLKSQMTRITFRQKSVIDSNNIINTSDATKLKERECIVDGNSDYIMIKTPWIDEDYILLHKYVPDIKIPTQEEKKEIINIKKENNKIYTIDKPAIVDIEEKEIEVLGKHENTTDKPQDKNKNRKGVISLEDFKNANK
ncbi:FtsK/SpoIIIE domain-containing protein [Clostridium botulinum]|uniref:FtsK/SpoIIIE domain-containing protein n=1 Tax=Clostridium botulinum TaxID=1491 RepID=UPI000773F047|nr:FtsK/SpoIIIE domain-containing protein [Clostridium botulinum]